MERSGGDGYDDEEEAISDNFHIGRMPRPRHYSFMKMSRRASIAAVLICFAVDSADAGRLGRDLLSSNDIDVKPVQQSQFWSDETGIKWYPDVFSEAGTCKNDALYPEWMAYEKNSPNFLFGSEKDCCERYDCLITTDAFDTEARDDIRSDDGVTLDGMDLNESTLAMSMALTAKPTKGPSSSPSLAPTTGSPTSSPSRKSFWYPDVFSPKSLGCVYGSDYGPWMVGGGFSFIYESEEECCSKFLCGGYVPPSTVSLCAFAESREAKGLNRETCLSCRTLHLCLLRDLRSVLQRGRQVSRLLK